MKVMETMVMTMAVAMTEIERKSSCISKIQIQRFPCCSLVPHLMGLAAFPYRGRRRDCEGGLGLGHRLNEIATSRSNHSLEKYGREADILPQEAVVASVLYGLCIAGPVLLILYFGFGKTDLSHIGDIVTASSVSFGFLTFVSTSTREESNWFYALHLVVPFFLLLATVTMLMVLSLGINGIEVEVTALLFATSGFAASLVSFLLHLVRRYVKAKYVL